MDDTPFGKGFCYQLHNKRLLDHFPFPWTLTAVHAFSAALGSWICAWCGVFRPAPLSHPTTPLLALFSIQVVRATTPLFVLLFAWARIGRAAVSAARMKSLTPVILGVAFATYGDYTYTRTGLALTLFGTTLAALKTMLASRVVRPPKTPVPALLSAESSPKHAAESLPTHSRAMYVERHPHAHIRRSSLKKIEDGRVDEGYLSGDERAHLDSPAEAGPNMRADPGAGALHPLDVLFRLSPLACVQCLAVAWASGETAKWGEVGMSGAGAGIGWRVLGPRLALNGVLAFVLNYVSFVASRRAGALSMTVVANVKQALTVLFALLVFSPQTPSFTHVLGIALTLAGGAWYGFVELKERKEKETMMGI